MTSLSSSGGGHRASSQREERGSSSTGVLPGDASAAAAGGTSFLASSTLPYSARSYALDLPSIGAVHASYILIQRIAGSSVRGTSKRTVFTDMKNALAEVAWARTQVGRTAAPGDVLAVHAAEDDTAALRLIENNPNVLCTKVGMTMGEIMLAQVKSTRKSTSRKPKHSVTNEEDTRPEEN